MVWRLIFISTFCKRLHSSSVSPQFQGCLHITEHCGHKMKQTPLLLGIELCKGCSAGSHVSPGHLVTGTDTSGMQAECSTRRGTLCMAMDCAESSWLSSGPSHRILFAAKPLDFGNSHGSIAVGADEEFLN